MQFLDATVQDTCDMQFLDATVDVTSSDCLLCLLACGRPSSSLGFEWMTADWQRAMELAYAAAHRRSCHHSISMKIQTTFWGDCRAVLYNPPSLDSLHDGQY
jgi:hypothetical protein